MDVRSPPDASRYRDLSNWDALFAAVFGIFVSEIAATQGLVSGAGQIGTGMLSAGLFVSIRLCWPLSSRSWFWPMTIVMSLLDAAFVAAVAWTDDWIPALALAPLTFVQVWLFLKVSSALAARESRRRE